MIRTIWVLGAGAVLTMALAVRVVVESSLRRLSGGSCLCDRMGRVWGRTLLRWAGVRVHLHNMDEVDWDRPLVVVANHQSWFDVFCLMGHLPGRARFVGKAELSRIPVFGRAWRMCGHVSVDRRDRNRAIASLDAAGRRVRDEALTMVLFPEGTRSSDGELQPFKKGAFILALKTGVPVVPLGISGSRDVMPKGSFRIRPGEIHIRAGAPIATAGEGAPGRNELIERSRAAVAALMRSPAPDRRRADHFEEQAE